MSRLPTGGLIDRARPVAFRFDGRAMTGLAGDTLASALIANGARRVGRSFKYHRPRGILSAGSEEPNALVTLGAGARAEPNTRATTTELFAGLEAHSQNRWPSLAFDAMAVNQWLAPLFVAGFYYKTFMWPAAFWERLYEPLIRRAAGLGALSGLPDPDRYDRHHAFCDLLVIGAGPAGLAAALTAGRAGLRVILADEDARPGGRLLAERREVSGSPGADWAAATAAELASLANVTVLPRATVFGVYDGREYAAAERLTDHLATPPPGSPRQRLWKIIARRAFLAAGATERPLVFGGNDRPGVMLASAARAYVNRFAAAPGRRAAVFTTTDSGWAAAEDLIAAGLEVAAVIDARPDPPAGAAARARAAGAEVLTQAVVTEARGGDLAAIAIRDAEGRLRRLAVDLLAVSGGWSPTIALGAHLGARPAWSPALGAFLAATPPPGMTVLGAAAGRLGLAQALADGVREAAAVAGDLGFAARPAPAPRADDEPAAMTALWHVGASRGKAFVDFQHDVTVGDIALAAREGFTSVEHLKRYTTLGMATDQGRTSQVNGQALLAEATGRAMGEAGTILARPPFAPVAIGLFAGHHRDAHFRPERRTASHDWARARGAPFVDAGAWKRAQWFPAPGDRDWQASVNREVTATRSAVGICDVSTLGKIEAHGPDAGALLDRLYINTFSTLPVGRARYGVMLREDGMVMDDGVVTRLGPEHFFLTTTTANAARVMQHVDFARQALWPDLDVQACSVTEQWATWSAAGPRSRALLEALAPGLDVSDAALPHMGALAFRWRGGPARLFRVSFSGERAYEISVPAHRGEALAEALMAAGAPLGVTPYGVEALGVMRIEKGHPAGGELNGQTTARDLGLGGLMSRRKDFIGRLMARRPGLNDPDRPVLVGLEPLDPKARLRAGAHLLPVGAPAAAASDQGHVTSAAWSPTLGHAIALALLARGAARHGERIIAHDPVRGGDVEARVRAPVFLDPEGSRLRG
jgi:sarcosine oxidase subunit alpha